MSAVGSLLVKLLGLVGLLAAVVRYGYGWAMLVRGQLYTWGVLASEAFPVPVVALGNLRVGGTGKSPHAAYVVTALLAAGYRVALLSRGYGRRTRGFRVVTPLATAAAVGDEPLEQARRFAGAIAAGTLTVAVAEARAAGIRALLAGPAPPAVVVLDDAYQHRAVRPSLRIVLTEFARPFWADRVLPLGRLREFARAARRAHIVVITKCPPAESAPDRAPGLNLPGLNRFLVPGTPVVFTTYAYGPWQPLAPTGAQGPPPDSCRPVVLTAIDNPEPLLAHLRAGGCAPAAHLRFPDHHAFTPADLTALRAAATGAEPPLPVVTTGKDAVRLLTATGTPAELAGLAVWWVPVTVREVPTPATTGARALAELVLTHVREFRAAAGAVAGLLALALLLTPQAARAQTPTPTQTPSEPEKPRKTRRLLNDSSQTRYGAHTTQVFYEADALSGRERAYRVDTSFHEFWNPRRWYHDTTTFQQDLGNVGTGARALVWPVGQPESGIRWGRRAFDRYAYDLARIPYYNTRSPFSRLSYAQGARGEQVFEARYSRNVRKNFNFGGAYQRLSANKQFATTQPKDNFLSHAATAVWATYATPDSVWRVFAGYSHMSHEVIEQGSVLLDPTDTTGLYANTPVALVFARNREFRNAWHLTQLLRLAGPGLQLFYTFERRGQQNRFSDTDLQAAGQSQAKELTFFPAILLDSTRTQDDTRFRLNQHTAGVLGAARFGAYRAYASRRDAAYRLYQPGTPVAVLPPDTAIVVTRRLGRLAFGGEATFRVRDVVAVTADGELQTGDNTYWLRATARYRFLTVSQLRNAYAPTLTENALYGNHFRWENAFENTQRDESRAAVAGRLGNHQLLADVALARIRNFIYYAPTGQPRQEGSTFSLATVQARWRGQFGWLRTDVRAAYTARPGRAAVVIRTPALLADALIYYQGPLIRKSFFGQVGLQAFSQADVRALGWQPATQQFYVQDQALVRTYPQIDLFLAADLRNVNVFVKLAHLNQGWPRNGYYVTPGYPQLSRSFTFGVQWLFFD